MPKVVAVALALVAFFWQASRTVHPCFVTRSTNAARLNGQFRAFWCRSIESFQAVGFATHGMPEVARMDHSLY